VREPCGSQHCSAWRLERCSEGPPLAGCSTSSPRLGRIQVGGHADLQITTGCRRAEEGARCRRGER
jgi:hypothetical protein